MAQFQRDARPGGGGVCADNWPATPTAGGAQGRHRPGERARPAAPGELARDQEQGPGPEQPSGAHAPATRSSYAPTRSAPTRFDSLTAYGVPWTPATRPGRTTTHGSRT